MNYFDYKPSGKSLGSIWGLFSELSEIDVNTPNDSYSHTLDIVNSALRGNIDKEKFCLQAYECACNRTDKIQKYSKVEKELNIVDDSILDEDTARKVYGCVRESQLPKAKDLYAEIDDLESFEKNLDTLLGLREAYIKTKGIDIICLVKNVLKGRPQAKNLLRGILEEDNNLACIIRELMESSSSSTLLARLSLERG